MVYRNPTREEAMRMFIINCYSIIIYILFIYVKVLTAIAVALFVALNVAIRKLDKIKNTSLPGR